MIDKSTLKVVAVLAVICGAATVIYLLVDQDYYYVDGGPPGPHRIAMAMGSNEMVYLVWDVRQWDIASHNMQGTWIGGVDSGGNQLLWVKRVSNEYGIYPVIAVDESDLLYVIWIGGEKNGVVLDSTGNKLRELRIPTPNHVPVHPTLNIDQFGDLHLTYMEDYPTEETVIFDNWGNILDIVNPMTPAYNATYQLNRNSTSRLYQGAIEVGGEYPVYIVDSDLNTWIVSVNSEAYLTVIDQNSQKLVDNEELDVIPESIHGNVRLAIIGSTIALCITTVAVWVWRVRVRRRKASADDDEPIVQEELDDQRLEE